MLEEIYHLQKELIKPYIKLEGLPQYPLDINEKSNQKLLKEFISRVVEELAEAYECYEKMLFGKIEKRDEDLLPVLKAFNGEIADALHFFFETLIFCNIEPEDIQNYFDVVLEELELTGSSYDTENILTTSILYGHYLNTTLGTIPAFFAGHKIYVPESDKPYDEKLRGGNNLSQDIADQIKVQLWDITYALNIAGNSLKKKPWKQTEVETDEQQFQDNLMEAYVRLFRFLSFIGMKDISIMEVYKETNDKNLQRIKNKY